jgi:hypothetical protein
MLKQVQAQIQALAKKQPRTQQENTMFQKLVIEQNKILASGKLVPTIPGQHAQGLQFVSALRMDVIVIYCMPLYTSYSLSWRIVVFKRHLIAKSMKVVRQSLLFQDTAYSLYYFSSMA